MEKIQNNKLLDGMPPTSYKYGDRTRDRAFQILRLKQFPSVAYSASQNGAYYMNCSLFGSGLLLTGTLIGYEPADLTVHPPPQELPRVG